LNAKNARKGWPWAWVGVPTLLLILGLLATPAVRRRLKADDDPLTRARAAYEQRDWARAADFARVRLKADGGDVDALRILARASIRMGRDAAGAAIYNDRLGPEGMEAEDRYLTGLTIMRQGDEELAVKVWAKAAGESEGAGADQPELLLSLANTLARRQRFDEAAGLAERLAAIPGWEGAGLLLLGTTRFSLEDYAASADCLRRGLELDPEARLAPLDAAVYRKTLARCLLMLGRPAEADRWLEPVLNDKVGGTADPEAHWLASRSALQQHQIDRARSELATSGTYRADHPLEPEPSPYIGEAKCAPCHAEIGRAHNLTRHARTFHRGDDLLNLPRPDGPFADPDHPDVVHSLVQEGKKLKIQTKLDDRMIETVVDYAYGTTDRYFSLVGRDAGGNYRAVRRSFFREGKETGWEPTSGDVGHTDRAQDVRGQLIDVRDGVVRCHFCHVTNPREFRDAEKAGTGPEASDRGIGCERCHGPGANHVAAVEADFPDRAIVSVGPDQAEAVTQECRVCHIVGDASEMEHRREEPIWVRSPGATMAFSRCFTESNGALSCLTCHDPHRDSERSAAFYEKRCLACHSAGASATPERLDYTGVHEAKTGEPTVVSARSSPASTCKVNPSTGCVGCHMPKVPMPVLHTKLTDHYIRVHREEKAR
jgi:tetratricopeptide (TPR) repeat protein